MPDPPRFLVIRLSSIGDIVHTLPAVATLGETFPCAEIHWVVEHRLAALLERNPFVKRTLKLDTLRWRRNSRWAETIEEMIRSVLPLREVSYEAAIDFQGLYKSAFIAWLSRARERVGFAEYWLREPGVGVFYTERVSPRRCRHAIEMNMALVEHLGARSRSWQFPLPRTDEDDYYVEKQLCSLGATEFIILNPGGGWKSKRWPPGNYSELIRRLAAALPFKIVLTGSREEEGLVRSILANTNSSRAGYIPTNLVQLIALTRRAKLFVGGDTGPLHLAAAVSAPIVALYGSTDPRNTAERNGPFCRDDIILLDERPIPARIQCKDESYLEGIAIERVVTAIRERLTRPHG